MLAEVTFTLNHQPYKQTTMTKTETLKLDTLADRTTRMEQKQEDMADDIKEIKELLKAQDAKFAAFVDGANKTFITRIEGRAAMVLFSISVTLITVWLSLKDHIK